MTIARVRVYGPSGTGAALGVLPTEGLSFSVERGGGGGCTFTALWDDLDALSAWDSVIHVELLTPPSTWTAVAAYALRPPFRRDAVGRPRVQCTAVALLEQWASETVILPEYSVGDIPRGAGTDRGIGWMSSAYDPDADPNEAWAGCYETTRATYPTLSLTTGGAWPSGTGAEWISVTGASDEAERKLFRTSSASPLTVATAGPVRVHLASDSPGTMYIAGEPVLDVQGGEPGKEPITFEQADMWLEAGDYACAFDTESIWDTGGDGVDPMIVAICSLDIDGDPDAWLLVSNGTDWVACRRDVDPPDNDPPGPTPGAMLDYLVTEAQDRAASGWTGVTLGFSATTDSYSDAWPTESTIIERVVRYGADTLWSLFQMFAESDECDVWMGPDLEVQAAAVQGETTAVTLTEEDIATMSDSRAADPGTWVAALALDGWITASAGTPRREYGMEVGTALNRAVASRIVTTALAENGRWDGVATLKPTPSSIPLVGFNVGDTITITYADAPTTVQVLSVTGTALQASIEWQLELVELPA